MRNGPSSRAWLSIAAATVTAAMAFAPSALAGTAGTSAWRVRDATTSGSYSASQMSVTLALAARIVARLKVIGWTRSRWAFRAWWTRAGWPLLTL